MKKHYESSSKDIKRQWAINLFYDITNTLNVRGIRGTMKHSSVKASPETSRLCKHPPR